VLLLALMLQLKWNVPDETGGEAIQRYELLVTPQPAGWEGPPADEQVGCCKQSSLLSISTGPSFQLVSAVQCSAALCACSISFLQALRVRASSP
jgi:hypothetical protein